MFLNISVFINNFDFLKIGVVLKKARIHFNLGYMFTNHELISLWWKIFQAEGGVCWDNNHLYNSQRNLLPYGQPSILTAESCVCLSIITASVRVVSEIMRFEQTRVSDDPVFWTSNFLATSLVIFPLWWLFFFWTACFICRSENTRAHTNTVIPPLQMCWWLVLLGVQFTRPQIKLEERATK